MKTSIKARLLFLVIMPILAILALAVGKILFDVGERKSLEVAKSRIIEVEALSKAIHFMQIERGLSVGFVASGGTKNSNELREMRSKVNNAITEAKNIYASTNGDTGLFENLRELSQIRSAINALSINGPQTGAYFTKTIVSLVDASTTIPAQMSDKESRNLIQAYTHLSSAKELLGQIRANLNGAFTKNAFLDDTFFKFGGAFGAYGINLRKFENLATPSLKIFLKETYRGNAVDKTMSMINIAKEKGLVGGFDVEPSEWFRNVTASIDLLRGVELELYKEADSLINRMIDEKSSNIIMLGIALAVGVIIFAAFILYFIKVSISKPLDIFRIALLKISATKDLTIEVAENTPLELSQMAKSFNNLMRELKELIDVSKV
ncbi:MAG: nitrate- and nitrite sensing domain-containing protein, partial [Sulfurimonas sp.]|uniref:nitrate- and nitrite sensing domain-containing protein n=1 Tax=Sulfurimonas sp. TaxID=2022749 RepID=UPI0028CCA770